MKIQVRYFASIREHIGLGAESIDAGATTVGALRDELCARGEPYAQALAAGRAVRMAVDQIMAEPAAPLRDGCEVAFFPPVTGG